MAAQKIIWTTYISYKISPGEARYIKDIVDKNPRTSAVEIRNTFESDHNVIVSVFEKERFLQSKKVIFIRENNRKKRLKYDQKYMDKPTDFWSHI